MNRIEKNINITKLIWNANLRRHIDIYLYIYISIEDFLGDRLSEFYLEILIMRFRIDLRIIRLKIEDCI